MKILILITAISLLTTSAQAQEAAGSGDAFITCSSEFSDGSQLEFYADNAAGTKNSIQISGEDTYKITLMKRNSRNVKTGHADVLMGAVRAINDQDDTFGFVYIEAISSKNKELQLYLDNFYGRITLFHDASEQELKCSIVEH